MAEIKSTLELALERTRHLTMSAEEKARQLQVDFEKRLQGLLQQIVDRAISIETFNHRLTALQRELGVTDQKLVVEAILNRLDPDLENQHWMQLLANLAPALWPPLEQALAAHLEAREKTWQNGEQRLLERLAKKYGITGSALAPNLQKDAHCQKDLAELRDAFQTSLKKALMQMVTSPA